MSAAREKENHLDILRVIIWSFVLFFLAIFLLTQFLKIDTSSFIHIEDRIHAVIIHPDGTREEHEPGENYTIKKGDHFILSFHPEKQDYIRSAALTFNLYNCVITVSSGTNVLYQQDAARIRKGQMLGDLRYSFALPGNYSRQELTIEGDLISNSPFGPLPSVIILPNEKSLQAALADNEFIFYCFSTFAVVSILFMFFFLVLSVNDRRLHAGIWASLTSLLLCVWYLGYKTMLYVISDWGEFNAVVEYMAIMALNIPLSFFLSTQFNRPVFRNTARVLGWLYLLFFLAATVLNFSSSPLQYCDLLVYSHIFTGAGLLFFMIGLFADGLKNRRADYRVLRAGLCISLAIGVVAFATFNLSSLAQNQMKVAQINFAPLSILMTVISLYFSVLTSYAMEAVSTIEAERLSKLAYMDSLTGAPNRSALYESLQKLKDSDRRDYVMIFMDINGLKETNDVHGHEIGDNLIILVSTAILQVFPQEDEKGFVGRWGGDEFIACVLGSEAEGNRLIEEFQNRLAAFNRQKLLPFAASVSVGKSVSTHETPKEPSNAINESDEAMYLNKAEFKRRLREA